MIGVAYVIILFAFVSPRSILCSLHIMNKTDKERDNGMELMEKGKRNAYLS